MSPDLGIFEFEQPSNSNHMETHDAMHHPQFITPFITPDDCDSPPSSSTRQRCKGTLTQDYILHMMEPPGYKPPFMPQQATGRRVHPPSNSYAILHMQSSTMRQAVVDKRHTRLESPSQVLSNDFAWLCSSLMSSTTAMHRYPQS